MAVPIAIIGMACRYPDARTPDELWENVLAQRRAFRRIPPERLRLEDYFSADRDAPDCVYSSEAALIENYEFDRVGFRVAGETFRAADLAHWLALDVAAQALSDGGFDGGRDLPGETTSVFLGNTLTGEFSRANVLRLRWPYVRRTVEGTLTDEGWSVENRAAFLERLEAAYKEPFPPIGEESLAGGLSNTIAGRICNHFDLKGGGYTIDGACASSLLAVTNACSSLAAGDIDVALAGGVDLSVDPFELVGFAKTGALASGEMRVYDARSDGFLPGEGCGFVVLMRHEDALEQNRRVYAVIRGWGISSDGRGGITRPEVEGQILALNRAYGRAGFGIETVGYFEGHGTGTSVGDAVELKALTRARRQAKRNGARAAIGSVKANIGHTKAAAGVAGLIKAAMAVSKGILPPTSGCKEPHAEIKSESSALRVLKKGELWAGDQPLRAGVSAMGFGGINTHIAIEGPTYERRSSLSARERTLLSSSQDAELFLLGMHSEEELRRKVSQLASVGETLSLAGMSDLAARLALELDPEAKVRVALVASTPAGFVRCLEKLFTVLESGEMEYVDGQAGVFFSGNRRMKPRIGFLFPGQGSPVYHDGGAWGGRFDYVRQLYALAGLPTHYDRVSTAMAQPAIVAASLAGLRVLEELDIVASLAVGHSLGELTALHWAGSLDGEALLRIAKLRGEIMAGTNGVAGAMASIAAGRPSVETLLNGDRVVIAAVNSPTQTVISGEKKAVEAVVERARSRELSATFLPVSHAFHSPLVAAAAPALSTHLSCETVRPLRGSIVSTVTGSRLKPGSDLRAHLCRQVTSPVLFMDAIAEGERGGVDLWLEVGPGRVLCDLASQFLKTPVVALDSGGDSLEGLLLAAGVTFVLGHPTNLRQLFAGRFTRPFMLDRRPSFFANPCERAPVSNGAASKTSGGDAVKDVNTFRSSEHQVENAVTRPSTPNGSSFDVIAHLVSARAELPPSAVNASHRLLSDLHLNSITVTQVIAEAARQLALPRPVAPTLYADATIAEVAEMLNLQLNAAPHPEETESEGLPAGVDTWVRPFTVELVERPLPQCPPPETAGQWQVFSPDGHPLADSLRRAFSNCKAGKGVVVCLPPEPDETHLGLLLEGAQAVLQATDGARFVLVQHGGGAAAFARALHLELKMTTAVVDVPPSVPAAAAWIVAEALAARDYSEAHYDSEGGRREPVARPLSLAEHPTGISLTSDDVLVVTGGAKGITAECVLALAEKTGTRIALFGLSKPDSSLEMKNNFERLTVAGICFKYYCVNVTDEPSVRDAIAQVEKDLGPVTGILHAAAKNEPLPLASLDESSFRQTLDVKVRGARNLLASINPDKLRLLITFGSVIARSGLPGEAHYGLANEWLARLTEKWQAFHPSCRCLCVEWSVWSGVGMGVRLGNMDALVRQGISPIPPDEGGNMLCQLVEKNIPSSSVVVMGRVPEMPTYRLEKDNLPFLRFIEQPRVYYPNIELVVDVELSAGTDPYLDDHKLKEERLLPAVIGLEAMAQVASALVSADKPPSFQDINFNRAVVVPEATPLRIRLVALERGQGRVDIALRSEETDFQLDHFSATCFFENSETEENRKPERFNNVCGWDRLAINPERDLYGSTLFHRGRFQRLSNYRALNAKECVAEISSDETTRWFSAYLPQVLLLGDPGIRDAAIHAIQGCIPHRRLLPVGVRKISVGTVTSESIFVRAHERSHEGDIYEYDLEVFGSDGYVRERWEGLRLQAVENLPLPDPLPTPLLSPYIERRVQELIPGSSLSVTLWQGQNLERRARSDRAFQIALGEDVRIIRRTNGKPEVATAKGVAVSSAHADDLTLAVTGRGVLGCDIQFVENRPPSVWLDLLGNDRLRLAHLISDSLGEDEMVSATCVWAASECLSKAGASIIAPLVLTSFGKKSGWLTLSSGRFDIVTLAIRVQGFKNLLVVGVLADADVRVEEKKRL